MTFHASAPPAAAVHAAVHAADPHARRLPLMRRVEIAALMPSGAVAEVARLVPAQSPFDEAFAAFARGTVLATPRGGVAVEDLWPGDVLRGANGDEERLVWKGSTMLVPRAEGQDPAMTRLTRLSADALGWGKPAHDLVLGPRARVVSRRIGVRLLTGRDAATVPAADLVDGVHAVDITPATPVEVFHLAFARHATLLAEGVEVEGYHPGPLHAFPLRGEPLALFLSCFPHLPDLLAWGEPRLPRLRHVEVFHAA